MDQTQSSQRSKRLREIAEDHGAVPDGPENPLCRPSQVPSFIVPDDERRADSIIGQLKIEGIENQPKHRGFKRPSFHKSKPDTTYVDLYAALARALEENGPPGVFEVLLRRFQTNNGNINVARKAKTGTMAKLRSSSLPEERGTLLQRATELRRYQYIQLLVPLADQLSLNDSLRIAVLVREIETVELLLQYGSYF
jgi:hypothetical protein